VAQAAAVTVVVLQLLAHPTQAAVVVAVELVLLVVQALLFCAIQTVL
jgi:hypothetical protein